MNDQNFSGLLKILVVFASCIEIASQGSKYRTKYSWHKNVFLFSVFLCGGGIKNKFIVVLLYFVLYLIIAWWDVAVKDNPGRKVCFVGSCVCFFCFVPTSRESVTACSYGVLLCCLKRWSSVVFVRAVPLGL
jgi:hypothetical protein